MKRFSSWPQVNILEDNDEYFLYPEVKKLQQQASYFERETTPRSHLETVNLEKANLEILNRKLIENSILSSQKILKLENENNRLIAWLQETETLAAVLHDDLQEADREKRSLSFDLGIQQQAFEIANISKKQVEKRMEMFKEASARDRNLIESKALEELGSLTNQLQALELQLKAKEEEVGSLTNQMQALELQLKAKQEDAMQVKILTVENKKLRGHNRELIKQNEKLQRQLNELQERFELQKKWNELLCQEVEDTKVHNTCSIALDAVPYEPIAIKLHSLSPSRSSTLTAQWDDMTPPPLIFLQDYDDKTGVSCSERENEQKDPVDEYIRLSVKAAKKHFPYVTVSSDRLIEKAKMVPFHKVHDVLFSYMRKLEHKQSLQKEREMKQSLFDIPRPSILEKVCEFLGCGGMLDDSQSRQCNVMRQVWDINTTRYGKRVWL